MKTFSGFKIFQKNITVTNLHMSNKVYTNRKILDFIRIRSLLIVKKTCSTAMVKKSWAFGQIMNE